MCRASLGVLTRPSPETLTPCITNACAQTHYMQLAKAAGLIQLAQGGVDESAGTLVRKKVKTQAEEEVESLTVGSVVWVALDDMDEGTTSQLRVRTSEPYLRMTVSAIGKDTFDVSSARSELTSRALGLRGPRSSEAQPPPSPMVPKEKPSWHPRHPKIKWCSRCVTGETSRGERHGGHLCSAKARLARRRGGHQGD